MNTTTEANARKVKDESLDEGNCSNPRIRIDIRQALVDLTEDHPSRSMIKNAKLETKVKQYT